MSGRGTSGARTGIVVGIKDAVDIPLVSRVLRSPHLLHLEVPVVFRWNVAPAGLMSEETFPESDKLPPPARLVMDPFRDGELGRCLSTLLARMAAPAHEEHHEDERAS